MDKLIAKYADNIRGALKDDLEALMLIGSVARGEDLPGSDIEFLAVVKESSLNKTFDFGGENVSVSLTSRRHLLGLKPRIFTVETRYFGKVIWGNNKILEIIPNYSFNDIDPLDGFILLNNRIVEQLILLERIKNGERINKYDFDKGYIQLVNAYLAVNKAYKGLYPEKMSEFLGIYKDDNIEFVHKIKDAFASLKQAQAVITSKEEALERWQELRRHFKEIWLYEKRLLSNSLIPDFKSRLRGWAKLIKKGQVRLSHIKYIFWTSPQFMVYQKAAKEYFNEAVDLKKAKCIVKEWKMIVR